MFKIVEKLCDSPIRMLVKPGVKIRCGVVVKLIDFNGDIVADICDDGKSAFGITSNYCFNKTNAIIYNKYYMINIWSQRMVFRTTNFNKGSEYNPGTAIYTNKNGILTAEKYNDGICIARVISGPGNGRNWMECLWL